MTQIQDGQTKVKRGRQARNTGASQVANLHIGERIRIRRTLLGRSQSELGKALGLSFQQMQKYERGMSSIGAGQLCEIAKALDVPVSFFYDGLDGVSSPPNSDGGEREDRFARDELEMLGHYRAVPDFVRDTIRSLLGYMSNPGSRQGRNTAADGKGRILTDAGTEPRGVRDQSPDLSAGTETDQHTVSELAGSAPPEIDQARSAPQDQPVPAKRPRGRPRKDANQRTSLSADEAVPARSQPGGNDAGETSRGAGRPAASGTPDRNGKGPRRGRGAVWTPSDIGE